MRSIVSACETILPFSIMRSPTRGLPVVGSSWLALMIFKVGMGETRRREGREDRREEELLFADYSAEAVL